VCELCISDIDEHGIGQCAGCGDLLCEACDEKEWEVCDECAAMPRAWETRRGAVKVCARIAYVTAIGAWRSAKKSGGCSECDNCSEFTCSDCFGEEQGKILPPKL
jgi:hypothetical protein